MITLKEFIIETISSITEATVEFDVAVSAEESESKEG